MGNGDVFLSRNFVKAIMTENPEHTYSYAVSKSFDIYKDIPNLTCMTWEHFTKTYGTRLGANWHMHDENTMILPIWYVSCDGLYFAKGTHIDTYNNMFIKESARVGLKFSLNIYTDVKPLLPTIDFNYVNKQDIDATLDPLKVKFRKFVLFCNNLPLSGQCAPTSLASAVNGLAQRKPDYLFIVTNKDDAISPRDNIVFLNDIAKREYDLIECGYISTKCNFVIGRGSGPSVFTLLKENFDRGDIKFIGFCPWCVHFTFGLHEFYPGSFINFPEIDNNAMVANLTNIIN